LHILISELEHRGYESAARCLADDLDGLLVHLRYPLGHRERWRSTGESVKSSRVDLGSFGVMDRSWSGVGGRQLVSDVVGSVGDPPGLWACGSVVASRRRLPLGCQRELRFRVGVVVPGAKRRFWD